MSIKTCPPRCSITVFKTIARSDKGQPGRTQGGGMAWDLTPHLGDGSEISVSKSIRMPKGSFVITVPDQPYRVDPAHGGNSDAGMDTLYGLLEPMDEIEIRLAHHPEDYAGGFLPLLMQGFIRTLRRVESMSSDGKPSRSTVIQGNDYGWLFEMTQLPPLPFLNYGLGIPLASAWQTFFLIGAAQQNLPVGEFFQKLLDELINQQAQTMMARFTVGLDNPQPVRGKVVLASQDALTGPLWNVFLHWADVPWNELWVEDPETTEADAAPCLRFRTAPYRTWIGPEGTLLSDGRDLAILGQAPPAYETVTLDIADVVRLDASRSEQDVANIYWVETAALQHQQTSALEMQKAAAAGNGNGLPADMLLDGDQFPNSDPDLYSYRLMNPSASLLPDELTTGVNGQSEDDLKKPGGLYDTYSEWARLHRKALVDCNADNVLLEEGSMTVKGNERIRPGKYLAVQRGKFGAEYYAHTVTHQFAPYRHYLTTVQFDRGTGFIERLKLKTGSPYLAEGKRGVYY